MGMFFISVEWIWKNKLWLSLLVVLALVAFLVVRLQEKQHDIKDLKDQKATLETVVHEYEDAAKALDGKELHDEQTAKIAKASAAAVAAGRQTDDGPMAGVLHSEYDRVRNLLEKRDTANNS